MILQGLWSLHDLRPFCLQVILVFLIFNLLFYYSCTLYIYQWALWSLFQKIDSWIIFLMKARDHEKVSWPYIFFFSFLREFNGRLRDLRELEFGSIFANSWNTLFHFVIVLFTLLSWHSLEDNFIVELILLVSLVPL